MAVVLQILASGFAAGAVYGLVAVGHAVVFRLTGVVHFAFGELIALGVFATLYVAAGSGPVSQTSVGGLRFLGALVVGLTVTAAASAGSYLLAIEPYRARGSLIGWVGASLAVAFAVRTVLAGLVRPIRLRVPRPAAVRSHRLRRLLAHRGCDDPGALALRRRGGAGTGGARHVPAARDAVRPRAGGGRAGLRRRGGDGAAGDVAGRGAFAVAGAFAGLAAVLAAPSAAFDVDAAARYGLYGLVAAVVAWFDPRRALAAGLAVGLVQATVTSAHLGTAQLGPAYRDAVPLLVCLALLAWRARTLREAVE